MRSSDKLRKLVLEQIEYKQFPYANSEGNLYIGIGRDLNSHGISLDLSLIMFEEDADYYHCKLIRFCPFYVRLSPERQQALIALCFYWGFQNLLAKTNLMLALESHDYARAAQELANLDQHKISQIIERNEY